ncbi:hypothetical protein COY12_02690 [Candidatus Roizmanbacteria bacterium CG_4_10_14_0_2_um_filter_33_96]|uniref:Glycosyltransferase RgtA/B/C/D-like domain-containing protein n=1 Tax=Candidatus Roizmanbacteria bacterium CG_4_10_14_0_2_um_filter_33_96 TaxID=1974821 RepID=A0A2M7U6P7_9BACT|nr:MAG: hypothetical protein COY12_02690 [Candidatus Roizmanbacteria bacterium CG_4_10_14_0_2_um_filter_33_96]
MKKIFITALLIRLISLYLFRNVTNYDLQSYIQVGELTLKGINIYPDIANLHHPYLPFFLYVEAMAVYFDQSKIIVITIIKFINIIFDLGILYLVYLLLKKNLKTAFFYAINPVTILVTTLHGQFDVIPVFFILLTIYLLNKKQELLSVLSFSFAILTKTWPILFLMPLGKKIKNKKLTILIMFFPVLFTTLYCIFFKANPIDIGKTLISYQGLWGIWGPWVLLGKTRIFWQKLSTLIFLISFFGYSYFNKEKNLIKNILQLLFFFFIFTTNFSIQYFVWIIPFLILIKPKKYFQLLILIMIFLLSFYCIWVFRFSTSKWLTVIQNTIGFILWLSFIKVGYLSKKIT